MACRVLLLLALVAAATAEVLNGTSPVVMTPLEGKVGQEKVMVLINGAFVPNTDYIEVSQAIQAASPLKLWVTIPSFTGDCPNPVSIGPKVANALKAVEEAGFTGLDTTTDVVIAGHSLGGIFAQLEAVNGDYTGLVLLGSYITSANKYTVDTYPKPALTLAGELDGLTRITRVAQSWVERDSLLASPDADEDTPYLYAIPSLHSVTHSQFCSNVNVTSFGTSDLCPEISWSEAHTAIGDMVAAYLAVLFDAEDELPGARSTLDAGMDFTKSLTAGFISAQEDENGAWCAQAQETEVDNATLANVLVVADTVGNAVQFDSSSPAVDVDAQAVTCVSLAERKANPTDASTTPVAATELDCKVVTSAELSVVFDAAAHAVTAAADCSSVNDAAVARAYSAVAAETLARWTVKGKPFATQPDKEYSTGASWKAASFSFDDSGSTVEVTSPRLTTDTADRSYPGEQMCKYLSAARAMEYMMVDGLPTYDSAAC